MLADHKDAITDACAKDFGKPYFEANFAEVSLNMNHIVYCLEHLAEWAKPDFPEKGKADLGNSLSVVKEPFGGSFSFCPSDCGSHTLSRSPPAGPTFSLNHSQSAS